MVVRSGAILGAVAKGRYASVDEACAQLVRERDEYLPRSEMRARYAELYEIYKDLWPAVRDAMHRLS